jgi:hypothetical protein
MQVGGATSFTQIYNQMRPGPLTSGDKHLRLTGTDLHTHSSFKLHGTGAQALQNRQAKYAGAADAIKSSLDLQFGQGMGDRIFNNLGLGSEVRLRDLGSIKREAERLTTVDLGRYRGGDGVTSSTAMLSAAIEGRDQPLAAALERFGQKSYTSESFDFLRAVHDYRQNPTAEKARAIVDTFIDGGQKVNPHDRDDETNIMFRAAKDALQQDATDVHAFDKIFDGVFSMTAYDTVPKFIVDHEKGRG